MLDVLDRPSPDGGAFSPSPPSMSRRDISRGSTDSGSTPSAAGHVSPLSGRLLQSASTFQRELWFLVLATMLMDVTLTVHGLQIGLHEHNPIARSAIDAAGVVGLYGLKLGALAIGVGLWLALPRPLSAIVPLGLALPTTIAVVNNALLILIVMV